MEAEPTISASVKRILTKATDLGWETRLQGSVVHHEAELMTADGKTGQRGEVKVPAHDETNTFLLAWNPKARLGFKAWWCDGKFVDAHIVDPIGFEVENWSDYEPGAMRRVKDEPTKAFEQRKAEAADTALRRAWEYNDGTTRHEKWMFTKRATELTQWLDDWLRQVNPSKAPKPKPQKAAVDEQEQALAPLQNGEWHG